MIEAVKLKKSFGAVKAVRGVSFTVDAGEAVGFLGPNGAGKTTTFRMLAGTIGPTSGHVKLAGHNVADEPLLAKRKLGYMAENAPLYPELTAGEYLQYRAELKGIARDDRAPAVKKAAEQTEVADMLGTQIAHLSKGYRQRTALADALLGDPPILLLDEPTSGLDPNQVIEVRKLIRKLAEDRAVVLSTHILSEVEATCSRAIVIHEGRVVASGPLGELQQRSGRQARLVVRGQEDVAQRALEEAGAKEIRASTSDDLSTFIFVVEKPDRLGKIVNQCVVGGLEVHEASPARAALDEAFAQLTAGGEEP